MKRTIEAGLARPDHRPAVSVARPVVLYVAARRERPGMVERFDRLGYGTIVTSDTGQALRRIAEAPCDVCLIDLAGDRAALTTIRLIRARYATLPLIGLIDPGAAVAAADAVRGGVADLLTWPFDDGEMAALLADVRDRVAVPATPEGRPRLIAHSTAMRDVMRQLRESAADEAVCVCGAAGTGKGLLAQGIHDSSPRADRACVLVDCAGVLALELERALFGAARTGHLVESERRESDRISAESALGRAAGGTLVVRHLTAAPIPVQQRLATALRRRAVVGPHGSSSELDVRLVATVEGSVPDAFSAGQIHPELAGVFSVRIDVPPLRRREDDVPHLATHLLERIQAAAQSGPECFSRAALILLAALPWPGNGDELERTIEALASRQPRTQLIIQIEDVLKVVDLAGAPPAALTGPVLTLRAARVRFERECIATALARHQGSVAAAARALGIQRTNLYRKVRQLGLSKGLLSPDSDRL